jgi:hypothetical protein
MEKFLESKKRINSIEKRALFVLIFLSIGSIYYQSVKVFLGIILGGCLALINIKVLVRIVENMFNQKTKNRSPIIWQYIIKIFLFFGIIYFLIYYKLVNIIAFVVGFSAFVVAIILETIYPPSVNPSKSN